MEKLFNWLTERKKTAFFILGSFALWMIVTVVCLAIIENGSRDAAVALIIASAFAIPAVVFTVSGALFRAYAGRKPAQTALSLALELLFSAVPMLSVLLDIHMFWDYPLSSVFIQAGISIGCFLLSFFAADLVIRKKEKR